MKNKVSIGVTTFINDNYGTTLQAFALQEKLKQLGAFPYLLEVKHRQRMRENFFLKRFKKNPYYGYMTRYRLKKSKAYFDVKRDKVKKFIESRLKVVRCEDYVQLNTTIKNTQAFIAGSDQIWNPNAPIRDEFLLAFEILDPVKKYTYAVSMGVNSIDESQGKMFRNNVSDFKTISFREQSGVDCLSKYIQVPMRTDVDPTLLFDGNYWSDISKSYVPDKQEYIFVYMLRPDKKVLAMAKALSAKTGLKIYYTGNLYIQDPEISFVSDAGVEEFLGLIKNAAYVVTNSFHGTAFSLQFHKKVVSMKLAGTGDRAKELLEKTNLSKLLFEENNVEDFLNQFIKDDIDYTQADEILKDSRNKSIEYIKNIVQDASVDEPVTERKT